MDLAVQLVSNASFLNEETKQDSQDYKSQSLQTQTKNGGKLLAMILANERALNLMEDDKSRLSTEND